VLTSLPVNLKGGIKDQTDGEEDEQQKQMTPPPAGPWAGNPFVELFVRTSMHQALHFDFYSWKKA
jgi:hypothetical protein